MKNFFINAKIASGGKNGEIKINFFYFLGNLIFSSSYVNVIKIQEDGKLIVARNFEKIGGSYKKNIARLNPDGTLDENFLAETDSYIYTIALQKDGKILIGGKFKKVNDEDMRYIARLNPDGSLYSNFEPHLDGEVYDIEIQPDGKIIVAGDFKNVYNYKGKRIVRLNPNGSVDIYFKASVEGNIRDIALQPDGKIIIGGSIYEVNDVIRYGIARLNPDGTLDNSFNVSVYDWVNSIAIEENGSMILGGCLYLVNGKRVNNLVRIFPNGSLDENFMPEIDGCIFKVNLQKDWRILISGFFSNINNKLINYFARISPDGNLDDSFIVNPDNTVTEITLQKDGMIYIGGGFSVLNKIPRYSIARLNSDGSLDYLFNSNTIIKYFPVVTNSEGANGSLWKTDLILQNITNDEANISLTLHYPSGEVAFSYKDKIAPKSQISLKDLAGSLNLNITGTMELVSNQEIIAGEKIYNQINEISNCFKNGTFGAYLKAYTLEESLKNIKNYYIPGLYENENFRTSLHFINISLKKAYVYVDLFDTSENLLSHFVIPLEPFEYKLEFQVFKNRAQTSMIEGGLAKINISCYEGIIAFASVIDNNTNDPIFILPQDAPYNF